MAKTGRNEEQVALPLPGELRERLRVEAAMEGRSVEAEIVARLQRSFQEVPRVLCVENQHSALANALLSALTRAYVRTGEGKEAIARQLSAAFLDYFFDIDELVPPPRRPGEEILPAGERSRRRRATIARAATESAAARARRDVAEGEARIGQQRERVAELIRDGRGTAGSEALLATLEETLEVMREHLDQEETLERVADARRRGHAGPEVREDEVAVPPRAPPRK